MGENHIKPSATTRGVACSCLLRFARSIRIGAFYWFCVRWLVIQVPQYRSANSSLSCCQRVLLGSPCSKAAGRRLRSRRWLLRLGRVIQLLRIFAKELLPRFCEAHEGNLLWFLWDNPHYYCTLRSLFDILAPLTPWMQRQKLQKVVSNVFAYNTSSIFICAQR